MLHRPMSHALFVGVVCLSMATLPGPAPADVYFETTYLPTSSVVSLSSSILPTSYVVPTSYSSTYFPTTYFPTSYLPTSSVIDSGSVVYPTSTTYVRRSLFRPRRYVERTYYSYPLTSTSYALPTTYLSTSSLMPATYVSRSYVSPTSYVIDDGVIQTSASSSSYPCETTSSGPTKASVTRPSGNTGGDSGSMITSKPSTGGMVDERRPQGSVNSSPTAEEAPSSAVNPATAKDIPVPATLPTAKPETPTPPQPMEERKPEDMNLPLPGESGKALPKTGEMSYRSVRRPNSYDGRNILRGRVISADSRQPEEGVTVIISNATRNFSDRPAMTDADGQFKVSLPDGDWTVKVKMPSGSVYAVGRDYVTASSGRVTDSSGRNVTEFLITR